MNQSPFVVFHSFNIILDTFSTSSGGGSSPISVIQQLAFMLMAAMLMLGVYEAFFRQGSLRDLGVVFLKYVAVAAIVQYWPQFFRHVANATPLLAQQIADSMNVTDVLNNYPALVRQQFAASDGGVWATLKAAWSAFTGSMLLGIISLLGGIVYMISAAIFTLCFNFWGVILYLMGPLLLAFMPSLNIANVAKNYVTKLLEWACWPLLYTLLLTVIAGVLKAGTDALATDPTNVDLINVQTTVMSLVAGIAMCLIPFLANRLVQSDFVGVGTGIVGAVMMASKFGKMAGKAAGGAVQARAAAASPGIGGSGTGKIGFQAAGTPSASSGPAGWNGSSSAPPATQSVGGAGSGRRGHSGSRASGSPSSSSTSTPSNPISAAVSRVAAGASAAMSATRAAVTNTIPAAIRSGSAAAKQGFQSFTRSAGAAVVAARRGVSSTVSAASRVAGNALRSRYAAARGSLKGSRSMGKPPGASNP